MLPFLRSDLARFVVYTPHPEGSLGSATNDSEPIDRLDTNESPYDLPDELKQKLAGLFWQQLESNRYPDSSHLTLKAAIAEYVNESAALSANLVASHQISVSNGSDELIRSLLIATCLGGEGAILVAQPTFSMYVITAQTLGIPVVAVERSEDTFEIDLEAAQAAIADSEEIPIRVVFVVHPNSPTGNGLTEVELAWLRGLPEQILVVIDEAYFEFSQSTVVGELAEHRNWVVLRTFSKAFRLAAHRVGYAIAHPELIATLEKVRLPYNLPSFSQAIAQAALTHRRELLAAIPDLLIERDRLVQRLSTSSALRVWQSDANFIFVRLWASAAEQELDRLLHQLKAQGTLVRQVSGGLRITIGSPKENQRTAERLEKALGHC